MARVGRQCNSVVTKTNERMTRGSKRTRANQLVVTQYVVLVCGLSVCGVPDSPHMAVCVRVSLFDHVDFAFVVAAL